jgi:hypothetical protein
MGSAKLVLALGAIGLAALYSRRAQAAPIKPQGLSSGDLRQDDARLLVDGETRARIPGLARFLAVVGAGESNWGSPTRWSAHNKSEKETKASERAYKLGLERGFPAIPDATAPSWGSGGMFGIVGVYGLWGGRPAFPLLNRPVETLFQPEVSIAAAAELVDRYTTAIRKSYDRVTWWHLRLAWANLSIALEDESLTSPLAGGGARESLTANEGTGT